MDGLPPLPRDPSLPAGGRAKNNFQFTHIPGSVFGWLGHLKNFHSDHSITSVPLFKNSSVCFPRVFFIGLYLPRRLLLLAPSLLPFPSVPALDTYKLNAVLALEGGGECSAVCSLEGERGVGVEWRRGRCTTDRGEGNQSSEGGGSLTDGGRASRIRCSSGVMNSPTPQGRRNLC